MKGVLFNIESSLDIEVMWDGVKQRLFGPLLNIPDSDEDWSAAMAGTFADLAAIEAGDKVFFFKGKTIYGVGEVMDLTDDSASPVIHNFPGALEPCSIENISQFDRGEASSVEPLYNGDGWEDVRLLIPFRESHAFFEEGVDMDYVLSSNQVRRSPYLEFFERKNFSLLGEEEAKNLARVLGMTHRNPDDSNLITPNSSLSDFEQRIEGAEPEKFSVRSHLEANYDTIFSSDGIASKENWIHALAIEALKTGDEEVLPEELSSRSRHQVFREFPSAPAKPTTWADHTDILTEIAPQTESQIYDSQAESRPTVGYEIIEVKRGDISYTDGSEYSTAHNLADDLAQLLKYVDYFADHLADGNYGSISAYLLTGGYSDEDGAYSDRVTEAFENRPMSPRDSDEDSKLPQTYRTYTEQHHNSGGKAAIWNDITLLEYGWDDDMETVTIEQAAGGE